MGCLFCKIVNTEIPSDIIYQDEYVIAFADIHPVAPIHILFIPREHLDSVLDLGTDNPSLVSHIFDAINRVATEQGWAKEGFRIVTNIGNHGGQTVNHLHFHVLAGRQLEWPPG